MILPTNGSGSLPFKNSTFPSRVSKQFAWINNRGYQLYTRQWGGNDNNDEPASRHVTDRSYMAFLIRALQPTRTQCNDCYCIHTSKRTLQGTVLTFQGNFTPILEEQQSYACSSTSYFKTNGPVMYCFFWGGGRMWYSIQALHLADQPNKKLIWSSQTSHYPMINVFQPVWDGVTSTLIDDHAEIYRVKMCKLPLQKLVAGSHDILVFIGLIQEHKSIHTFWSMIYWKPPWPMSTRPRNRLIYCSATVQLAGCYPVCIAGDCLS